MVYEIKYYEEKNRFPVLEFIELLLPKIIAKLLRNIDLPESNGLSLGFPFISRITGTNELWELRTKFGPNSYRIIFFHYWKGLFVLLHAFIKKTSQLPKKEIKIALNRLNKYKGKFK